MTPQEMWQLLTLASRVDSRRVTDSMVAAWLEILPGITFKQAHEAIIEHRRRHPGVYLEPGHVWQQVGAAKARHREIYGMHPAPPAGQRWAVDAIEALPAVEP